MNAERSSQTSEHIQKLNGSAGSTSKSQCCVPPPSPPTAIVGAVCLILWLPSLKTAHVSHEPLHSTSDDSCLRREKVTFPKLTVVPFLGIRENYQALRSHGG